jgi:EAL domain-containing protein (putative c-di-GMP-specific phosphodiesterase class I)
MNKCIALGVSFALNAFGTGYSYLTYLRRLPADLIKIDQSFIRDMLIDLNDLAIVEGVITLAKSFKHQVIAEGVETIEHGTALLRLGCDWVATWHKVMALPNLCQLATFLPGSITGSLMRVGKHNNLHIINSLKIL